MNNATPEAPATATGRPRVFFLDWLRVLSMLGIFFFHNARFYDIFGDWHVRNATTSIGASIPIAFMSPWIMPLFFVLAGAGTYYALKFRKAGQFLRERTLRLFIPLVFGMLVIVVPQAYFQALADGYPLGQYNLFQVYVLYLQSLPDLEWFHLWYLYELFLFSVVFLPILFNRQGASLVTRLANAVRQPWALLALLAILLAIVNIFLFPAGFWGHRGSGGWNIVSYIIFFLGGYLIFSNERLIAIVRRLAWWAFGTGLASGVVLIVLFFEPLTNTEAYFGTPSYAIAETIHSVLSWSWILAALGLGSRFLERNNRFLAYGNEAVLPFYILHQTVIISIGFFVVQWQTGIPLKYLIISSTSFIVIMAIYELLVRRINLLRFLFGMRAKARAESAVPSTSLAAKG